MTGSIMKNFIYAAYKDFNLVMVCFLMILIVASVNILFSSKKKKESLIDFAWFLISLACCWAGASWWMTESLMPRADILARYVTWLFAA